MTVTFTPFGVASEYSCRGWRPIGSSLSCVGPAIGRLMLANRPPLSLFHFQTVGGVYRVESFIPKLLLFERRCYSIDRVWMHRHRRHGKLCLATLSDRNPAMDVHPPHEPIRSWKDFTLHLLTITIGLLIALALEAAVQSLHHRHMVTEARVNLRREIGENHTLYAENLRSLQTRLVELERDIDQLRDLRAGKTPEGFELQWSFHWNSYTDSAWKSARDSGAVGYMRPEVIKKYSEVYGQQSFVNEAGVSILFDQAKAAAPLLLMKNRKDPKELSPGDIQALLLSAAELGGRVKQLQLFMQVLDEDYTAALQHL